MSRLWGILAVSVAALVALVALPALAAAKVYCVNSTGTMNATGIDPSCELPKQTIAAALATAAGEAGEDTVLIGPGDYTLPAMSGGNEISYQNTSPGNVLHLRGLGMPHLTMGSTQGVQVGMRIEATAGSTVEGLHLTVPANADGNGDRAIVFGGLGGVIGRDLLVDGPASYNSTGVELTAEGRLSHSTVELPSKNSDSTAGIVAFSGDAEVDTSTLRASSAVRAAGSTFKVERSTLIGNRGTETDGGTIEVHDSLIEILPSEGFVGVDLANQNNGTNSLTAIVDGTTIVGGNSSTAGIRVQADSGTETANATISNTILANEGKPLAVLADNGRTAKAVVSYSNYDISQVSQIGNLDGTGAAGLAELVQSNITDFAPGFVDAAGGDYRLLPGSQLIDAGNPTAPAAGALALGDSPRAVSATACPVASGRRDLGAYELVPSCPSAGGGPVGGGPVVPVAPPSKPLPRTTISGKHRFEADGKRAKVVLTLGADQPGATFSCRVDRGKFHSCRRHLVLHLTPGRHTVRVVAVVAGQTDPTPAKAVVRVVPET